MIGIMHLRDLTTLDIGLLVLAAVFGCCFFLAGLGAAALLPIPIAVTLIPLLHLAEYLLAMRRRNEVYATVVDYVTDTYRVSRGRYSNAPSDDYVIWRPIVEFETQDGTVRAEYSVYSGQYWFRTGEEHEICYSVQNPKIFCFTSRRFEPVRCYLLTFLIGLPFIVVILMMMIVV